MAKTDIPAEAVLPNPQEVVLESLDNNTPVVEAGKYAERVEKITVPGTQGLYADPFTEDHEDMKKAQELFSATAETLDEYKEYIDSMN